jgi:hypothetical protein
MKFVPAFMVAALLGAAPAFAAPQTWRGQISDSMCGQKHPAAEHGKKVSAEDCTKTCVEHGAQYVFVTKGKVYQIANQQHPDVLMHAGHSVILKGELTGDTIKVISVDMP